MRLTSLRVVGFKSFVEPTEVPIEPGLTGVVGPNGCGKSNLVEALRWVMGESSHKNMRALGMDDVIFGGTTLRPARNTAEVLLRIDNSDRRAPAAFNHSDALEVSRRIERGQGSSYHVNGREVRARDIQLLFADAATGARSPALVRQGQIAELIAAKPQARRRILEDAAGIAGLHARRHEAELRLRHAEDNLLRVEDVLREIESQADALRRQGRQAARYRNLSAEIRKLEARLAAAAFQGAEDERSAAEAAAREAVRLVADRTAAQGEAARAQAVAAHELEGLRKAEIEAAAALRRLTQARAELDAEERRSQERLAELERRIVEAERDRARQAQSAQEAAQSIARIDREVAELATAAEFAAVRRAALEGEAATAERELVAAESALAAVQAELAEATAQRSALARGRKAEADRAERAAAEGARLRAERASAQAALAEADTAALRGQFDAATSAAAEAEQGAAAARRDLGAAREAEGRERAIATEADKAAQRLETELRTLTKLLSASPGGRFSTMLDAISVARGYEQAVAAALGDDLDASPDPAAPLHWRQTVGGAADPELPAGAVPLAEFVTGPAALTRRLRQIGLVTREQAAAAVARLAVGQRLVSREGDLWRWDGLTAAAEAPTAAARRLAERNRLSELEGATASARAEAEASRAVARAAEEGVREASRREAAALDAALGARRRLDQARDAVARAERRESEAATRLAGLADAMARVEEAEREARARLAEIDRALAELPDVAEAERRHLAARARAAEDRARSAELRAALGGLQREAEAAARRRAALATELKLWSERAERGEAAAAEIEERVRALGTERDELAAAPDTYTRRRHALAHEIALAEARRNEAGDRLAMAERQLAEADRQARASLEELAGARERRAASEARAEAAARRVAELTRSIADSFDTTPTGLLSLAADSSRTPFDPAAAESRLVSLKADRERLGGVNLRAEEELAEAEEKRDRLAAERDDLVEAIKRLRQAISNLNRDGRERLTAAFGTVNAHFRSLFTRLFGGGEAELTLIDSEDPLEAGLEITARPPGKKPQVLSLLSGGEQALTATALIFAVFLTNPSPVCVLDEVDAPLDDANVERYCALLRSMAAETDTRFVVITHNPITMAEMDRLFGVTMAERGISQMVSVDLAAAEELRHAG